MGDYDSSLSPEDRDAIRTAEAFLKHVRELDSERQRRLHHDGELSIAATAGRRATTERLEVDTEPPPTPFQKHERPIFPNEDLPPSMKTLVA